MGTDVDEDETSETSETQKQIINKLHATAVIYGIWMFGRKRSPTHTSTSPYSAGIGQHRSTPGEIDALAEAHIHVPEDSLALHVAFPSLLRACYEP